MYKAINPHQFKKRFRTKRELGLSYPTAWGWFHKIRLKNWIRGTHTHVFSKHLERYSAEVGFRFNRRVEQRRRIIFDRLLNACCKTQTITYKQLAANLN